LQAIASIAATSVAVSILPASCGANLVLSGPLAGAWGLAGGEAVHHAPVHSRRKRPAVCILHDSRKLPGSPLGFTQILPPPLVSLLHLEAPGVYRIYPHNRLCKQRVFVLNLS